MIDPAIHTNTSSGFVVLSVPGNASHKLETSVNDGKTLKEKEIDLGVHVISSETMNSETIEQVNYELNSSNVTSESSNGSEMLKIRALRDTYPDAKNSERISWLLYDVGNSAFFTAALGAYLPPLVLALADVALVNNGETWYFAGVWISVVFQLVLYLAYGAAADYGDLRKRFWMIFAFTGGFCSVIFGIFSRSLVESLGPIIFFGSLLLMIFANAALGASLVFYNASLPVIVDADSKVRKVRATHGESVAEEVMADRMDVVSNQGYGWGYGGGLIFIFISLLVVVFVPDEIDVYRINIFLVGIWWIGFTIPALVFIPSRPSLPFDYVNDTFISASIREYSKVYKHVKNLPTTFVYLVTYFFYSDGYTTIAVMAGPFAAGELNATPFQMAMLLVNLQVSALVGTILYYYLAKLFSLKPKTVMLINLFIISLCPIYFMIGLIPNATIGMVNTWEMYVLATVFGLQIGPMQAYGRSIMGLLTPKGHESEFFALYEITDRGSTIIGPLVLAIVTLFADVRWVGIYIFIVTIIPLVVLSKLDLESGYIAAAKYDPFSSKMVTKMKKKRKFRRKNVNSKNDKQKPSNSTEFSYRIEGQ